MEGGMAGSRCGCRGAVLSLAPCCVVRRSMKRVCRDCTKAGSRTCACIRQQPNTATRAYKGATQYDIYKLIFSIMKNNKMNKTHSRKAGQASAGSSKHMQHTPVDTCGEADDAAAAW